MRVVVPYVPTALRPETVAALEAGGAAVELVDVSGSVVAYWQLLTELWEQREDVLVVEHDVVIAPGTLAAFDACPHIWCSAPQVGEPRRSGWQAGWLQCNRFRREAMLAHPTLLKVPPYCRHWLGLDNQVLPRLERRVGPPHVHFDKPTRHLQGPGHQGHFPAWKPSVWSPLVRKFGRWLAQFAPDGADVQSLVREAKAHLETGQDDAEALNRLAEAVYLRSALRAGA